MPGLQKIPKETILAAIEKLGPCQPIDVRKELKLGDTFLIGALLSEMVADGTLGISKTRRGGSPFYYQISKPETLEKISSYLNEKDRRTYAMLKEQKVMREDAQEPLVRVGLQNIHDFSKSVDIDGVAYWRHFLVDEEEARKLVGPTSKSPKAPKTVEAPEAQKEQKDEKKDDEKKDEKKEITTTAEEKEIIKEAPVAEKKTKKPRAPKAKPVSPTTDSATNTTAEPKPKKSRKKTASPTVTAEGSVVISPEEWLSHDTLYDRVKKFANGAQLREARIYKPHGELTCVLQLDTVVGKLDVFLHAFDKKFTEEDVEKSLTASRARGLPLVVLSASPIPSKVRKGLETKGVNAKTFE